MRAVALDRVSDHLDRLENPAATHPGLGVDLRAGDFTYVRAEEAYAKAVEAWRRKVLRRGA